MCLDDERPGDDARRGRPQALDALSNSVPLVTLPSELWRGRHAASIYAQMALTDWVAADANDFVRLATTLGTDDAAHADAVRKIRAAFPARPTGGRDTTHTQNKILLFSLSLSIYMYIERNDRRKRKYHRTLLLPSQKAHRPHAVAEEWASLFSRLHRAASPGLTGEAAATIQAENDERETAADSRAADGLA